MQDRPLTLNHLFERAERLNPTKEVVTATSLGAVTEKTVTEPGSYHVEVWVKPKHLVGTLGPSAGLADSEYLWFITNPIRVK